MAKLNLDALTDEQLVHRELELERELLAAGFRLRTGQLEDTSRLRRLRRDIARIRTAERARELSQGLPKDSLRNRYRGSFQPGAVAESGESASSGGFIKGLVDKMGG
ncbi:MAG: 50S ribosomal protein L29 [Deltaproteobacteria bacterium]|nr:MAG: 50S ribosomal protein L29 [Deltaproteobacteria bacterium]